jgi:PilZ domain
MLGTPSDRRGRQRLKLPYAVVLHRLGEVSGVKTTIEDISSDGFYCLSAQPFSPNEKLHCEIVIPNQDSASSTEGSLLLRCRAEVVRVMADGRTPGYGLACRLQHYTIVRQSFVHKPEVSGDVQSFG